MLLFISLLGPPSSPINIVVIVTGSRTANISWQEGIPSNPENPPTIDYEVLLSNLLTANVSTTSVTLNDDSLIPLIPFTNYTVTIVARNRIGISNNSEPVTFMTNEERKLL